MQIRSRHLAVWNSSMVPLISVNCNQESWLIRWKFLIRRAICSGFRDRKRPQTAGGRIRLLHLSILYIKISKAAIPRVGGEGNAENNFKTLWTKRLTEDWSVSAKWSVHRKLQILPGSELAIVLHTLSRIWKANRNHFRETTKNDDSLMWL